MRSAAMLTAATIVADSGVDAAWNDCTPDGTTRRCDPVRGPRALMIRILPNSPATSPRQPADASGGGGAVLGMALGVAIVQRESGTGVLGTIYMDRVRMTAERTGVDPAVLLGRAIAHEAGHLLLQSGGHARSGLMREVWTDTELSRDRRDDWLFTAKERRLLRATGVVRAASSGGHATSEIAPPAAEARDIESTR